MADYLRLSGPPGWLHLADTGGARLGRRVVVKEKKKATLEYEEVALHLGCWRVRL